MKHWARYRRCCSTDSSCCSTRCVCQFMYWNAWFGRTCEGGTDAPWHRRLADDLPVRHRSAADATFLLQRKLGPLVFFAFDELVLLDNPRAGVPTKQSVIMAGRPDGISLFEPLHG